MKMPTPFSPPFLERPGRFGLLPPTLLESDAEREKRIATVEKLVADVFQTAATHLGAQEARRLFARVARQSKRGKGKAHAPDRDTRLLKEYDGRPIGESVTSLARRLQKESNRELGATDDAIAAQIRKLAKERKDRNRSAAVSARRLRMAYRNATSLLSSAEGEK